MESQPKNPEFRNNPENFVAFINLGQYLTLSHYYGLLITLANRLNPDQARQNVQPDMNPNCSQRCYYGMEWPL